MSRKNSRLELKVVEGGSPTPPIAEIIAEKMIFTVVVGKWVGKVRVDEWTAENVAVMPKAMVEQPFGAAVEEAIQRVIDRIIKEQAEVKASE